MFIKGQLSQGAISLAVPFGDEFVYGLEHVRWVYQSLEAEGIQVKVSSVEGVGAVEFRLEVVK